MVYCSKCGTSNPAEASVCSKCGASLQTDQGGTSPYWLHGQYDKGYHYQRKGAGMGALIFGIIIIILGLSMLFPEVSSKIPWWPIILILIGCWLIFNALRRRAQIRRTQQQ